MCGNRQDAAKELMPLQQVDILEALSNAVAADNTGTPLPIATAFTRTFRKICKAYDQADGAYLAEHHRQPYDGPTITGHELLKDVINAMDTATWVGRLALRFPPWFTHDLTAITFVEDLGTSKRIKRADGTSPGLSGRYDREDRAMLLSAEIITPSTSMAPWDRDAVIFLRTESERRSARERILTRSIDHEKTHHAHGHTLSVRWLRRWQEIVEEEKFDVSLYVTTCREQLASEQVNQEDLCESIKWYKDSPAWVFWNAPKRFYHINDLLHEFEADLSPLKEEIAQRQQTGEKVTYDMLTLLMDDYRIK